MTKKVIKHFWRMKRHIFHILGESHMGKMLLAKCFLTV